MHSVRFLSRSFLRLNTKRLQCIPPRAMHATAPGAKVLRVLHYEFVEGMLEKRTPYREEHLKQAADKEAEGKLVLAGAMGESATNGMLIFKDATTEEIEAYARSDPYNKNGLVCKWTISPYTVVHGTLKDVL